ncbi:integrase core domain-containing protein [Dyadobacter endophyticus]|uniref:integrase core domain-containing protein n=1 Tax=Dyadobacter endophyticus TaxID=1749036 RepID=UPI003CEF4A13
MDLTQDALFSRERLRVPTAVKSAQTISRRTKARNVFAELSRICLMKGCFPERIQYDNGSEFISKEMDLWAYSNGVTLDFSRPGKPTDNPYVESFNGKFRDECLSVNWFLSLDDAREKIEDFRWEYNHFRPHSAE